MLWQPALPSHYLALSDAELAHAITARRQQLGNDLIILGHHYQQDDVIAHADFTGDSFKLSQLAAKKVSETGCRYVIFCGVHFMAESADILTPDDVVVILPDLGAGCSMADMAAYDDAVDAWEQIDEVINRHQGIEASRHQGDADSGNTSMAVTRFRVVPITYVNSSAAVKSIVGEHGGAVCTSSNARSILEWAFAGGTQPKAPDEQIKVLFLPDQHLGRNTAAEMGYDPQKEMCVWDPQAPQGLGGLEPDDLIRSDVILWKGHCSVHKLFRPEHVDQARARDPQVNVIVHPECEYDVVQKADISGSTEKIGTTIREAAPGSRWVVGTEVHMVNRLANEVRERGIEVRMLSDCQCLCTTMYRIDQQHLLWVLDNLAEGKVVNQISVDAQTAHFSRLALDRMLDITAAAKV